MEWWPRCLSAWLFSDFFFCFVFCFAPRLLFSSFGLSSFPSALLSFLLIFNPIFSALSFPLIPNPIFSPLPYLLLSPPIPCPSLSFLLPAPPSFPAPPPLSFALSDERARASCSLPPHAHTHTQRLSSVPESAGRVGSFAWIFSLLQPVCASAAAEELRLRSSCCVVSTRAVRASAFLAGVSGRHQRLCPFRDTQSGPPYGTVPDGVKFAGRLDFVVPAVSRGALCAEFQARVAECRRRGNFASGLEGSVSRAQVGEQR